MYPDSIMFDLAALRQADLLRAADHHRLVRSVRRCRPRRVETAARWLRTRFAAGRKRPAAESSVSFQRLGG